MLYLLFILINLLVNAEPINPTLIKVENGVELIIPIAIKNLAQKNILTDTISLKIDNPDVKVGALTLIPAPKIEGSKKFLDDDFAILAKLNCLKQIENISVELSYGIENLETTQKHVFTLPWPAECKETIFKKFTSHVSSLLTQSSSLFTQAVLALILGLLMSLTPCLYPMIPITMGILQSQGDKKSLVKNAAMAFSYSCGIAFTFALLGLTAAFTGQLFGKLMQNPVVQILLVVWLIYMAFGMLGMYELYMPKNLGQENQTKKGNSYLTAFLFGALSGTIASPCLSPGLALLLTIVAALADITKGFILLFAFGIGLGIPLTIIGTFSGSIGLLPRAGLWMIEVKRIFGILLLLLAYNFAGKILDPIMLIFFVTICSFAAAIYYYKQINKRDSKLMRFYKIIMSSLLATSPLIYYKLEQKKTVKKIGWLFNIEEGQKIASTKKQHVLVDFSTDYCSLCNHLEAKLFENDIVAKYLDSSFVNLYINLSKAENQKWQAQLNIKGVPTIIVLDENLNEIKRFGSELIDYTPIQFIALLKNYENSK